MLSQLIDEATATFHGQKRLAEKAIAQLSEMLGMVRGRSVVPRPERHAAAMVERERKDFHFEFTTLRFKPIAEYGSWEGRTQIVPACDTK